MSKIEDHKRINDILLGPLERPALQWFSARMPAWVNPDVLTGIGIIGSIIILVSYILTGTHKGFLWLASFGFFLNWFGDSLDGTLARYRKIERPKYGFFVDHTVDAASEAMVILGLGLSPYVKFEIACLTLIGYLLLSVFVYVDTCVTGTFKISYGKIGPTELRVIVVIVNTIIFFFGNPALDLPFGTFTVFDLVMIIVATLLTLVFLVSSTQRAIELAKVGE